MAEQNSNSTLRIVTFGVLIALFSCVSAQGQTLSDLTTACLNKDPIIRLNACTILLGDERIAGTNLSNVYNNRGLAYTAVRQSERAIQDFNHAIEADPTNALVYSNRGLAYDRIDQLTQAATDFDKAIELDPKNASFHNNRCYILTKMGKPEDALADCEMALKLAPDNPKVMDTLGYTQLRLGQYPRAIESYSAALKLSPDSAESLFGRGIARQASGDIQGATDINSALAIDKNITDTMQKLGIFAPS